MSSLCSRGLRLARSVHKSNRIELIEIPIFLCPSLFRASSLPQHPFGSCALQSQRRQVHTESADRPAPSAVIGANRTLNTIRLPLQCAGCGALSQTSEKQEPGYYDEGRRSVKAYLGLERTTKGARKLEEEETFQASLRNVDSELAASLSLEEPTPFGISFC